MEFASIAEILTAVVVVLGGQSGLKKGYDVYKRKRNGGVNPGNSFSDSSKEFIKECFNDQTEKLVLGMKTDRLELIGELKDFIRSDGDSTREAVRGM